MGINSDAGPVNRLPDVGRIQGVVLQRSALKDPKADKIELQYTDRTPLQKWHSVQMPLLDALYLLNILESLSRDEGFDHLRRPPG
jgi:hypothetical protein